MYIPEKIDLHMHTTVSDGTDTPEEILGKVRDAGIRLFSVTDHNAIGGGKRIQAVLQPGDPRFITGVEFNARDQFGQYHILGYRYDPEGESIRELEELGHRYRMEKLEARLNFLRDEFGFEFPEKDLETLYSMDNPGKPHIGNLMVRLGFTDTKETAITQFINKLHVRGKDIHPADVIIGILGSGGIPVLAHPAYGSGDQLILGDEMDKRIQRLMKFGLQGIEAYYSGFTPRIRNEMLGLAEKYDLYVTAGSDYHGKNKMISLGDTGLDDPAEYPEGMLRFLEQICPE
ncbi:MAG: PHP domain-containing protein [Solobacterium sp.]|nr:PHP domain-containing protein [Solobacterium sp.]